jgi:hypothetical protein
VGYFLKQISVIYVVVHVLLYLLFYTMFDACILLCRLQSQVLDLDGVGDVWLGAFIEGGLRGGSVTMQTEVENRLPLSMLIKSIQALDDALLVLPFKTNYWLWRYGWLSVLYLWVFDRT